MNDIKHFQPQFAFKILACLDSGKPLISKVQKVRGCGVDMVNGVAIVMWVRDARGRAFRLCRLVVHCRLGVLVSGCCCHIS